MSTHVYALSRSDIEPQVLSGAIKTVVLLLLLSFFRWASFLSRGGGVGFGVGVSDGSSVEIVALGRSRFSVTIGMIRTAPRTVVNPERVIMLKPWLKVFVKTESEPESQNVRRGR